MDFCLPICLFICLSVCTFIYLSVRWSPSNRLSNYLLTFLFDQSTHLFNCQLLYMFVHLSINYLSAHFPSISLSVCPFVQLFPVCSVVHLFPYLSVHLSIISYFYICLVGSTNCLSVCVSSIV